MSKENRILIFTGTGKGKTTAALGMSLRAWGHDWPVAIIHFVKSRRNVGEVLALARLDGIDQFITGEGFLPPPDHPALEKHRVAALEGLEIAREKIASAKYKLIVLDEICWAVHKELFPVEKALELIDMLPEDTALALTGRFAHPDLIARADTVTEMTPIKHAYEQGLSAQVGIEK